MLFINLWGRTSILRRRPRSQLPSDTFGEPLVEVSLLTVDLPVLLLLQVDRSPLVVGEESILDLGTKVATPEGGDDFADGRVRLSLRVSADREEDVSWHHQHPCNIQCSFTERYQGFLFSENKKSPIGLKKKYFLYL